MGTVSYYSTYWRNQVYISAEDEDLVMMTTALEDLSSVHVYAFTRGAKDINVKRIVGAADQSFIMPISGIFATRYSMTNASATYIIETKGQDFYDRLIAELTAFDEENAKPTGLRFANITQYNTGAEGGIDGTTLSCTGCGSPNGMNYGSPMSNDINMHSEPRFVDTNGVQHPNLINYFLFNFLSVASDLGIYDFSDEMKTFIDENTTPISTDKSTHFDVYIKTYKDNPVMGGYVTSSIVVRWSSGVVKRSTEEEEGYKYQPNNTTIHLALTDSLYRVNMINLADVLYGELEYKVSANKLFELGGKSDVLMKTISAVAPATVAGDVYLALNTSYEGEFADRRDICVAQIPMNSATTNPQYLHTLNGEKGSTVQIHYITGDETLPDPDPENPGWGIDIDLPNDIPVYDPSIDDLDPTSGFNSNIGLLTKSYAMTETNLQNLGNHLWSDGFMDSIERVNNSPIENIVSVKSFPFTLNISGGHVETVKLGNVSMDGSEGVVIPPTYTPIKTIGSFTVPKKFTGHLEWLNYSPYTKVSIHLPYIGFKELSLNEYMGKQITVKYIYDIITGVCTACLYCGGVEFEKFSGNIAIDIPISASNRAQVEAGILANGISSIINVLASTSALGALSAGMGFANGMLQAQYHTQTTGNPSPSCDGFDEQSAYVIIDYPVYYEPTSFKHDYGYPCNLSLKLGTISGYTKCYDVDVTGVSCTENERQQIKELLESGVYL